MLYRLRHRTAYSYSTPVSVAHNLARLSPVNLANQTCLGSVVRIDPAPDIQQQHTDAFGNTVTFFALHRPTSAMTVEAISEVEVWEPQVPPPDLTPAWTRVANELRQIDSQELLQAYQFKLESPFISFTDPVRDYIAPLLTNPETPVLRLAFDVIAQIHSEFKYEPNSTNLSTSLDELLAQKRGVCQDFTHLALACLRSAGLAARYVSGYLRTVPRPGQPRLTGIDQSHAWFSLFIPPNTWVDLDPTNNLLCKTDHITVAIGRDYADICPVRGVVMGGGTQQMEVAVDVEQSDEESLF